MPTYAVADGAGRSRRERPAAGLPAEHRRRLVHAGDRHLAERARLDEQHVPPHRRGQLQQPHLLLGARARCRPTRSPRAAERAGKKVAQVDWVGGAQAGIAGPTVDFTNFFSTRGVLAAPLNATEQAGAAAFGISYQVAGFAPASGWTNVPAGRPGRIPRSRRRSRVAIDVRGAEPEPHLRRLRLRQHRQRHGRVRPRDPGAERCREGRQPEGGRPRGRRLQGDQAHAAPTA